MVTTNELIAASRVKGRDGKDRQRAVLDMAMGLVAGSIRCVTCNNRPMKLSATTKGPVFFKSGYPVGVFFGK